MTPIERLELHMQRLFPTCWPPGAYAYAGAALKARALWAHAGQAAGIDREQLAVYVGVLPNTISHWRVRYPRDDKAVLYAVAAAWDADLVPDLSGWSTRELLLEAMERTG